MSSAEEVVNHDFGVAVVTMPYIVSVSTAIDMLVVSRTLLLSSYTPLIPLLMGIASIDGSVVELKRLGGEGSSSGCEISEKATC